MGRLPVPVEEPRWDDISETIAGALRWLECGRSSSFTCDFRDQHFSADPVIAAQAQTGVQRRQQKEPFEFPGYFDQEAFENVNDELDGVLAVTPDDVARVAADVLAPDAGLLLSYVPEDAA